MDEERYKRILKIYYLMTPVFMLLDFGAGLKLRVVLPTESGGLAFVYYALCFASAFFVFKQTMIAALFSLLESALNLLLLLLTVFLPVVSLGQDVDGGAGFRFGVVELLHFFVVGSILLFCFYQNPLMSRGHSS